MRRTQLSHWESLCSTLNLRDKSGAWHQSLVSAYSEPHRFYHNLQHLEECLSALDETSALANDAGIVEAALWFHDSVYNPSSNTNEEDSATLAIKCFSSTGLPTSSIDAIRQLILCTKHHRPEAITDAALLIDIDLAILGQPMSRFLEYEHGIKAEYAWVPAATYSQKRSEILASFLQRPVIYRTAFFRERYEATARTNLSRAIQALTETTP